MDTGDDTPRLDQTWQTGDYAASGGFAWPFGHADETVQPLSGAAETENAGSRQAPPPNGGPALWGMGLLMGAAAMYLLDAENGERRRAGLVRRVDWYRDEVERTIERERVRMQREVDKTVRTVLRRVRESMVPDQAIAREINARLEDILPFEEAARIHVTVRRGLVTLEGAITEDRLNRLLGHIATVPGVRGLDNRLVVRASTTR